MEAFGGPDLPDGQFCAPSRINSTTTSIAGVEVGQRRRERQRVIVA
jgi:hypothetical protein